MIISVIYLLVYSSDLKDRGQKALNLGRDANFLATRVLDEAMNITLWIETHIRVKLESLQSTQLANLISISKMSMSTSPSL